MEIPPHCPPRWGLQSLTRWSYYATDGKADAMVEIGKQTTGRAGGEDRKLSQKEAEENNWETPSGNTMVSAAGARAPRRRISRQAAAS